VSSPNRRQVLRLLGRCRCVRPRFSSRNRPLAPSLPEFCKSERRPSNRPLSSRNSPSRRQKSAILSHVSRVKTAGAVVDSRLETPWMEWLEQSRALALAVGSLQPFGVTKPQIVFVGLAPRGKASAMRRRLELRLRPRPTKEAEPMGCGISCALGFTGPAGRRERHQKLDSGGGFEARPLKRKQGRTRGWRNASWAGIEGRASVEFGISLRAISTQTHRSRWDGASVTSRATSNKARNGFCRTIESRHQQTQEGLRSGMERQVKSVSCKASGPTHHHVYLPA